MKSSRLTNLILAFLLGVAHASSGSPKVTIEVGNLDTEDGDAWMLSQLMEFQRAHPEINVVYHSIGFPSRNEVRIEDLHDLALNVLGVISDRGYEVEYLSARDLIEPIDRFL